MKRNLLLITAFALGAFLLESFGDSNGKNPGGSPGGYSGSPHDNKNCKNCHGGQALAVTNWITSNVPASGYVPGTAYTITVTATGSGKKGFEVSPQSLTGNLLGTLTPGTSQHLVNANKAVTHSSYINTSTATWSFTWLAPAAGTGEVTFYGAIIVGLSSTKLCTLVIPESTSGILESSVFPLSVFPNPSNAQVNLNTFIPKSMNLKVRLINLNGQQIKLLMDETVEAGNFSRNLTLPVNVSTGVYVMKLEGEDFSISRKIIIH